ncbi:transposase family protein [Frigidibacter sp. MR17.14]|uniref:transposase family protein n=1 Tax=Frigidibacter sp. MR17.14 TaxID=3126509 RepID=UPI003012AD82
MSAPRFHLPAGTEVTLGGNRIVLSRTDDVGYWAQDLATGETRVVSFRSFAEQLKLPGAKLDYQQAKTGNRQRQRLGGYASADLLPDAQRLEADFHVAICLAAQRIQEQFRAATGNPAFTLSIRKATAARKEIAGIVSALIGQKVQINCERGGRFSGTRPQLYRGRKIVEMLTAYEALAEGESAKDELVPLHHKKGNPTPRITYEVRELMTQAWEECGLDTKKPSAANVKRHLDMLITERNRIRVRNGLPELVKPSETTLRNHRQSIIGDTAYLVATVGEREGKKRQGAGSTDIRALLPGEYVEIDECKLSLVVTAKAGGRWEHLGNKDKKILEKIDEEIRQRLHILVMIDVATRMPLAWVVSDQPRAEATLALLRMATRSKEREARRFGCRNEPVPGIGLGHIKSDNGPGLRNATSVAAVVGSDGMFTFARAHVPTERTFIERGFGTIENVVLRLVHGYTGRRPGDVPGYDAQANGVLNIEDLMELVTRFYIDEYPSMRHYGIGMHGRRPIEVWRELMETRGAFRPQDPDERRIHLGWEVAATPTSEGVRAFSGLWYNSEELQARLDAKGHRGKLRIFVDPDDVTCATVLIPGVEDPLAVPLQITAFADLSLPEVLELLEIWRRENPATTEIHEDLLATVRRERYDRLYAIGVERKLGRSYSTVAECQRKARDLFRGARILHREAMLPTAAAGSIMDMSSGQHVYQIGDDDMLIDGVIAAEGKPETEAFDHIEGGHVAWDDDASVVPELDLRPEPTPKKKTSRKPRPAKQKAAPALLLDPTQMRRLE